MRKFYFTDSECVLYLGRAEEVDNLYKAIDKASKKGNTALFPVFCDRPIVNYNHMYGLMIDDNNGFRFVNTDAVCLWLAEGVLVPEEVTL